MRHQPRFRTGIAALFSIIALCVAAWSAPAQEGDSRAAAVGDFQLVPVGTFDEPMFVTAPAGDASRLFVVERDGRIQVVRDGITRRFLEVPGPVEKTNEGGLWSMAFAPDYASSRKFYVAYFDGTYIRIDEFRRSPSNPDRANPSSRRRVLRVKHSTGFHYGGQLQFGPDGLLYISTGDNAQDNRVSQNLDSLLAKILRIDPRPGEDRGYRVPPTNPFAGRPGARPEIWAYGLRNPYRFSFDRRNGDLALTDVGNTLIEEINFRRAGAPSGTNFGWSCFEGTIRYGGGNPHCDPPQDPLVPPVIQYRHLKGEGCSIIGGYVVRHPSMGSLRGRYVNGDWCLGVLRSAKLSARGGTEKRDLGLEVAQYSLSSFGEDAAGCIYVTTLPGPVYRLASSSDSSPGPCPLSTG